MHFSGNLLLLDLNIQRNNSLKTICDFLGFNTKVPKKFNNNSALDEIFKNIDICLLDSSIFRDNFSKIINKYPKIAFIDVENSNCELNSPNFLGVLDKENNFTNLLDLLNKYSDFKKNLSLKLFTQNTQSYLKNIIQGSSFCMMQVRSLIQKVTLSNAPVLITGPLGSGKELAAKAIHKLSFKNAEPFIKINCSCLNEELCFKEDLKGTLFFDEIGDISLLMQAKLLRFIEKQKSNNQQQIRIIAASRFNLESMVEKKTLREDLFYHLNIFPIEMPALKNHCEDIEEIADFLIKQSNKNFSFSKKALYSLKMYKWPGNVQELSNLIERIAILHKTDVIDYDDLPKSYQQNLNESFEFNLKRQVMDDKEFLKMSECFICMHKGHRPTLNTLEHEIAHAFTSILKEDNICLKDMVTDLEIGMINHALDKSCGIVSKAADILGLRRTTLIEKIKRYNLK